jgi:hypothetical protein
VPFRCRLLGHLWHFHVDGAVLLWTCERCAVRGGTREYPTAAEARRCARTLNRGRPGPPEALLAAMTGTTRRPADIER